MTGIPIRRRDTRDVHAERDKKVKTEQQEGGNWQFASQEREAPEETNQLSTSTLAFQTPELGKHKFLLFLATQSFVWYFVWQL